MKFHFVRLISGAKLSVSGSVTKTPSQRTIETIVPLDLLMKQNPYLKFHGLFQSRVYLFNG